MPKKIVIILFSLLGAMACESTPDGRCTMHQACCSALESDPRFSAHGAVRDNCPPPDDLEGLACYDRNMAMLGRITSETPVLRELIPQQCL